MAATTATLLTSRGRYRSLEGMRFRCWFPILTGTTIVFGRCSVGAQTNSVLTNNLHFTSAARSESKHAAPGVRARPGAARRTHGHHVVRWIVFALLMLSSLGDAAMPAGGDLAQRIQRGESFLTNLFDPWLELLPEYRGSSTYWLFHDNYLAAHLLARTHPDLSRRIRSALAQFGVTNSGKIEIVFGEAQQPLPFRTYLLANVAVIDGKTIRTELVTTNILAGWNEYADLVLLASLAQGASAPADARKNFDQAVAMWDGEGFKDRAARDNGLYATYKLALYLIAADRLKISAPHRDEVIARLSAMQSTEGGWKTDYKAGKPVGLANVETTCLSLLALRTLRE